MSDRPSVRILVGDVRARLRELPDDSVQCVVTSPPYWGLRDYGCDGQIGLEGSFDEFLAELVSVFDEVRRVLRPDGVAWVNMGDSYAGSFGAQGKSGVMAGRGICDERSRIAAAPTRASGRDSGAKPKDLIGQPWALAFALRTAGWFLRADVIWSKPNPMPESVIDRPSKAHEYVFLFSKSARYFYDADAIREPLAPKTHSTFGSKRKIPGDETGFVKAQRYGADVVTRMPKLNADGEIAGANARTVWEIATQPTREAHFATFPERLADRCIRAGSREGDLVLDPFMGAGTTGLAALKLGRNAVGCELNPEYAELAEERIRNAVGLLGDVELVESPAAIGGEG